MGDVALVTGHEGDDWQGIAELTLPYLSAYCDRCGYALDDAPLGVYAMQRPASWGKIPLIMEKLQDYPTVIWVDADVLVLPHAPPIHHDIKDDDWQAMVVHDTPEGEIPSCGVWIVRRAMNAFLMKAWLDYTENAWWEQAAIMRQMGYDIVARPVVREATTELYRRTTPLDNRWETLAGENEDSAYFRHPAGLGSLNDRMRLLRSWEPHNAYS